MRSESEDDLADPSDARSRERVVEAFLEECPAPSAAQILAWRRRHPASTHEIIEAATVANALALHLSPDPKEHEVDGRDVAIVRRAFDKAARKLRDRRVDGGER